MPAYCGKINEMIEDKPDDFVYGDKEFKSAIKFTEQFLKDNNDLTDVDEFWVILYDGKLFQCTLIPPFNNDMFRTLQDAQKAFVDEISQCVLNQFRHSRRTYSGNEYDEDGNPKEGSLLELRTKLIKHIMEKHNVQFVKVKVLNSYGKISF